jgi:hypothetical protein
MDDMREVSENSARNPQKSVTSSIRLLPDHCKKVRSLSLSRRQAD